MLLRLDAGRRALAGLACALTVTLAGPARADDADDLARRHFESGAAYLEESDYDNALKAFQKAYDLSHRPEILLNIATVQERRGDLPAAIAVLQAYLQADPTSDRAETTRLRIQNLQKRLAEAGPPAAAPPATTLPSPPATTPPPPSPPPAVTAAPTAAPPPPPPAAPAPNHVPSFIAFGVGGAALVAAVVTGVVANGDYQDDKKKCGPNCSDAQISSAKSMALVSDVTTAVAVVGAAVGVTLWFTAGPTQSGAASPRVRIGLGPTGPAATASFGF
ncbi:MAG TPA: tetratricopeptide repeat protein [Polyangiaceae bacterium]|nr:tetratricopeptide repeat protein [Polyangiaceae bacterium]